MTPRSFALWLCLLAAPLSHAADTNDIVLSDFEGDGFGEWTATRDAFGRGPARGTLVNQQAVAGFLGRGYVNSYHGGDKSTGTLTSPEFAIARPYLNFLIGGGNRPGEACVNLVVDGKVVKSSTGAEFEQLRWHSWQLFQWMNKNKKARLEIIDRHTGGWGHINLDQIVLSSRPRVYPAANDAITGPSARVTEAAPRAASDPARPIYHFLARTLSASIRVHLRFQD